MSSTPSTTIVSNVLAGAELVPPSGAKQPSQGVGVGVGSTPPVSGGPAEANEKSAQTSAPASKVFLTGSSPLLGVMGQSGFAARIPHDTPIEPAIYVLWRSLLSEGRYTEAADLCRERAMTAPTEAARVCHVKDLAIIQRSTGDYSGAFDIHVALNLSVERFSGAFRARIEHGFARSLETTGRHDFALERYTEARWHAERGGDILTCAQIDTNTGRCLTAAHNPTEAHSYFDRASRIATQLADFHLLGEIAESRALAYEAQGLYPEAEASAWESVQLLTQTGDKTGTAESFRTWQRVRAGALTTEGDAR